MINEKRCKQIHVTVRFCDESELTAADKARMESAQIQLNRAIKRLFDRILIEGTTAAQTCGNQV